MSLLLQKLCVELLLEVIFSLPLRDVGACRQTCRLLSSIIKGSSLLQYTISQVNSSVLDIKTLDIPVDLRLDALRKWERSWQKLRVRAIAHTVAGPLDERSARYEIYDAFLINVDKSHNPGYNYRPIHNVLSNWTRVNFQSRATPLSVIFAMEHCMVAVISYPDRSLGESMVHLRLLDFLTGEAHPLAASPVLPVLTQDIFDTGLQVQAEVLGDKILIQVNQDWDTHDITFCQWYLVEWKTGRVVQVNSARQSYRPSFSVVSPDVIAVLQRDVITLCRLPRIDDTDPTLSTICSLELPLIRSSARYARTRFDARSNSGRPPRYSQTPSTEFQRLPFSNDPYQDTIRLTLFVTSMEGYNGCRYSLALSRKVLAAIASKADPSPKTVILRGEWFSRGAHLFEEPFGQGEVTCSGQRWIWQDGSGSLIVRDFNAFRARRAHSEIAEGTIPVSPKEGDIRAVVGPTIFRSNVHFAEDVVSELPYLETRSREHRTCRQILTDGEHLLGFMRLVSRSRSSPRYMLRPCLPGWPFFLRRFASRGIASSSST
ncbi:hypothetical protein BC834DRAFT_421422 [Gloeopeniophorella convolvens]|nr:hypothetical protein BC834DRAFT_421422 [Gloeopeniophorella convolvens]